MFEEFKWWEVAALVAIVLLSMIFLSSSMSSFLSRYIGGQMMESAPGFNTTGYFGSFKIADVGVCAEEGKPIVRMYSTTWCPHCIWVGGMFDKVAMEYVKSGKIVARHWNLDSNDDALTPNKETAVPESEMSVYRAFNPGGSVPTFVFGCRYYRVGNAYETQKNLTAEGQQFRAVINELLKQTEP